MIENKLNEKFLIFIDVIIKDKKEKVAYQKRKNIRDIEIYIFNEDKRTEVKKRNKNAFRKIFLR